MVGRYVGYRSWWVGVAACGLAMWGATSAYGQCRGGGGGRPSAASGTSNFASSGTSLGYPGQGQNYNLMSQMAYQQAAQQFQQQMLARQMVMQQLLAQQALVREQNAQKKAAQAEEAKAKRETALSERRAKEAQRKDEQRQKLALGG